MSVDTSFDPRTGAIAASIAHTSSEELDLKLVQARSAADIAAATAPDERRRWLYAVADALEVNSAELARIADWETALGAFRLKSEVGRTASQIRFYADVACEGSYLGATIDEVSESSPALSRTNVPLGPIAVFGASNFPFAFSVFGNDTASALAAGCSVVIKAHPAHPLVSARVFEIAHDALTAAGAPAGIASVVFGFDAGASLIRHRDIAAVAFTGSQSGGMSLWNAARERDVVIPVYAEMGTVNPVIITPSAAEDIQTIAQGFVASFTLGSGQFCTKPGMVFVPRGHHGAKAIAKAMEEIQPEPMMLTEGISKSVVAGIAELQAAGATIVAASSHSGEGWSAPAVLLSASLSALTPGSRLLEEVFGPVAVVIEYDRVDDVISAIDRMQGALAASVMLAEDDPDASRILDRMQRRVGRIIVNDWPTGVAFTWAQHHGGPWPATSEPTTTSVGASALERFLRPIAFQNLPDMLLPHALRSSNPWHIPRRINGAIVPGIEG